MQLLKITTTPIKYRIETERAAFKISDSKETVDFQNVNNANSVQSVGKQENFDIKSQLKQSFQQQIKSFKSDIPLENDVYQSADENYVSGNGYGKSGVVSPVRVNPATDIILKNMNAVSMDAALNNIESIKLAETWEPVEKEENTIKDESNPVMEFVPASCKLVVEELSSVEIEYLGGFNYFPKSSAPDYKKPEEI